MMENRIEVAETQVLLCCAHFQIFSRVKFSFDANKYRVLVVTYRQMLGFMPPPPSFWRMPNICQVYDQLRDDNYEYVLWV